MPKYHLYYFDLKGRAEPIRLAFSIGKIEFEDERLSFRDFFRYKNKLKFGQLPLLEVDDKCYAQSKAILKYVGRLSGLYPQTYEQQLVVDEGMELAEEMTQKISYAVFYVKDEEKKIEEIQKLQNEILPTLFSYYEKQLQETQSGFYASKLSVVDLWVYTIINSVCDGEIDNFKYNIEQHKLLNYLRQTIADIPEVQAFEAKHKKK